MKKTLLTLTLAAALVAGGLFALNARAETAGPRRTPGALLERAREKLGLTDRQVDQIRAVLKTEREALADLARANHAARTKLRDTIQADDATEQTVRAAAAELAQAQTNMAVERHKLFGKLKPILTREQLDKLAELQDRLDSIINGAISNFEERSSQ